MPDHENTFVLKSESGSQLGKGQEFVIQAGDVEDLRNWLIAIHACMSPQGISLAEFAEKR